MICVAISQHALVAHSRMPVEALDAYEQCQFLLGYTA